jgi:hypothetical protein
MLNNLFTKPLSLSIADQEISFNTLAEFEFCLAGRTEVPARKMADLVAMSSEDLKREAKSIKAVEKQFVELLSKSIESPEKINSFLKNLDAHVFSQDHNWRDVMSAFRDKGEDYDELRRVAFVKYMQYLTSRQEVIKHTYSVKKLQRKNANSDAANFDNSGENEGDGNLAMRETLSLDSSLVEARPKQESAFTRLPKGEAVVINAPIGSSFGIRLSKHHFELDVNDNCSLTDYDGKAHELQDGKNIIGRDVVCNVVVNSGHRDVSRLHMIVEQLAPGQVRLTDLSSHGTFVEAKVLES